MGKIEEVIYENYKKAIIDGDYDQAKRATELGKILKAKIEAENFVDYDTLKVPVTKIIGKYFNPFPYKYHQMQGVIELASGAVTLTEQENKLFSLFSQNETQGKSIRVVTKKHIASYMWGEEQVISSLVRINIYRLRNKIEPDPKQPQILISLPSRGYLFLGNKVDSF